MVRILSFFAIFFTSVAIAYFMYFRPEEDLPVYQPSDLNPALVDASAMREEDHRVLDFELINHLGILFHSRMWPATFWWSTSFSRDARPFVL